MDCEDDIIRLARAIGPTSLRQAVAQVKAAYGVPETRAYALIVRAVASFPVEATDECPEPGATLASPGVRIPAPRSGEPVASGSARAAGRQRRTLGRLARARSRMRLEAPAGRESAPVDDTRVPSSLSPA